jgi:hypothetical protein
MAGELEGLRGIDGRRLAEYLAAREEFRRAFPRFFRAVGDEVTARLAREFPGIAAHVGEDYRREAIARVNDPQPPLDWVAFSFPGYSWWDLHVGVVARLDLWPAICQVGVHWTRVLAGEIAPRVHAVDWQAAVGTAGELGEAPAFGEIQQRDLAQALDVRDLASEAMRCAERAMSYYRVARERVVGSG